MAEIKTLICDATGKTITEGKEVTLFIDYKGQRKTFHLSETAFESLAPHLPQKAEDNASPEENG